MSGLDDITRNRFLKEMGITVWSLRKAAPADAAKETTKAGMAVHEKPTQATKRPFIQVVDNKAKQPIVPIKPEIPKEQDSWEKVIGDIMQCQRCGLCATRNKVVPGVGDINAKWLFVGEGPGFNEDQQGEPFVGRSGKLLDAMLRAMYMNRDENVYIANIVKCRASDGEKDRQPTEEEAAACMPYLERQIKLIKPKIIVALGKTAAIALLNTDRSISLSALRNRRHFFQCGERKIPLVVTYHPSYLLRIPSGKKQAWLDLCSAMDIYDEEKKKKG